MAKQKIVRKKPSRHHWFLISVFAVIILLGLTAFILQRSTNIEAIAGEALRQRIVETKQLALTDDKIKIAKAIQEGKDPEAFRCPLALEPATEQHWILEEGFKFWLLRLVDVQCDVNRMFCYYADSDAAINRADQIITYKDIPGVKNCQPVSFGGLHGCDCDLSS